MLERVEPAAGIENLFAPHENDLVLRLHDELRTAVALDASCLDPYILLYKPSFKPAGRAYLEELTDSCVIGLDASSSDPSIRIPFGHFFCIHGKETIEGLHPDFKRGAGLVTEEEHLVVGFYFMPSEQFNRELLEEVRALYHTVTYDEGDISDLVLDPGLTVTIIESLQNERLRKLKKAESEFFGRNIRREKRKRKDIRADYDPSLEREADRAAYQAEISQKTPGRHAEARDLDKGKDPLAESPLESSGMQESVSLPVGDTL